MKKTFTILLLLATISSYAQKAKLELDLQKDSTYYLTMNAKMDIDQFLQGKHQIVKTTLIGKMAYKVVAIQDTLYTMDVIYNNLAMKMDVSGKQISFNSDGDTTNILNKAMRSMIGNSFNIVMSNRGKIIDVKNTENLFSGVLKAFPNATDEQKAQLLLQLKESFGEKKIRGNLQESFVVFPLTPCGVGSTWKNSTSVEFPGFSTLTKTTFTLDNITDAAYEISGSAIVTPSKVAGYKSANGFFMRLIGVSGYNSTKVKINKKTGWIMQSTVSKHIKGNIELKKTLAGTVMLTYPMVVDANLVTSGK